jgi:hypothetical protein
MVEEVLNSEAESLVYRWSDLVNQDFGAVPGHRSPLFWGVFAKVMITSAIRRLNRYDTEEATRLSRELEQDYQVSLITAARLQQLLQTVHDSLGVQRPTSERFSFMGEIHREGRGVFHRTPTHPAMTTEDRTLRWNRLTPQQR